MRPSRRQRRAQPGGVVTRQLATDDAIAPDVGAFAGDRLPILAQCAHPLPTAKFLKQIWRQRSLAVHGSPERFAALVREQLHGLSIPALLSDAEEIQVWFKAKEQIAGPAKRSWFGESLRGNASFKTGDGAFAAACHRAGASLYFPAPAAAAELLVTALAQQLGQSFGAIFSDGSQRSTVETFASRAGNVSAWHYDFMENFTLQLSGTKTWWLKPSGIDAPHRSCTAKWVGGQVGRQQQQQQLPEQQAKLLAQHAPEGFDPTPPDAYWADATKVEVAPGSVLYVPAGTWHKVECTEDSISINISMMGACYADLIADAVRQRLLCDASARAPICMASIAQGRAQMQPLLDLAGAELGRLTAQDLLPPALALPRAIRITLPTDTDDAADAGRREGSRPVRRATRFRRNPLCVLLRADGGGEDESGEDEESGKEQEEEEGGGHEQEGVEQEQEQKDSRGEMSTYCGGAERLAASADLFVSDASSSLPGSRSCAPRWHARYVLHAQFGSEDLSSLLRIEMRAPQELIPLLEWLRAAPRAFSAKQAWRAAYRGSASTSKPARLSFATAACVLSELERNGFCRRRRKRLKQQRA